MPKKSKSKSKSEKSKSETSKGETSESETSKPYIRFPKAVTLDKLPLRIGKNISVKRYNTYLTNRESTAYKLKREKNGEVFIIEMPSQEHEAISRYVDIRFLLANGANSPDCLPIQIDGSTFHESPNYVVNLEPDSIAAPHESLVQACPPGGYPGPPPGTHNNGPYARIVCEFGRSQSAAELWEKCEDWISQPYVRYVLGIKLQDKRTSRNALGQRNRTMTARVWWQPGAPPPMPPALVPAPPPPPAIIPGPIPLVPGDKIPGAAPPPEPTFFEWEFGTHHSGSRNLPTACTGPGLPEFQIQFSTKEIFWDPPLPAVPAAIPFVPAGYIAPVPVLPAGFLPIAPTINIDLYGLQQLVLRKQDNRDDRNDEDDL